MAEVSAIVTGATGFAGGHLLRLLAPHSPVIAWYRPGRPVPETLHNVSWQAVDILDARAVRQAIDGAKAASIFHLAGAPNVATSWQNAVMHLRTNALGTHHVLDAVRRHQPACRVLVVSSSQIYRPTDDPISEAEPLRPSNPYGLSKLAQDQLALQAAAEEGIDVVVARPFNHIGPGQAPGFAVSNFARQIALIERGLADPVLQVGNLEARRDVTDVRDVVAAYIRVMECGRQGRPYNICSGLAFTVRQLLDGLLRLSSAQIHVEVESARLRPHDAPVVVGDGTRIRTELGWAPTIRTEDTLRDTLNAWRTEIP